MLFVFQDVVSAREKPTSVPKWTKVDLILSSFSPQVAEVLAKVEVSVRDSIKKDYGSNTGLTSVWNTTMDQVRSLFYFKLFYNLKGKKKLVIFFFFEIGS